VIPSDNTVRSGLNSIGILARRPTSLLDTIRYLAAISVLIFTHSAHADLLAHWTFNDTAPGAQAGAPLPDSDGRTVWRQAATDHSGNGNHLTTWDHPAAGFSWTVDSHAGDLSIQAAGDVPGAMTWSAQSNPTGVDIETFTPAAFTVEALFKAGTTEGHRTIVGRDGRDVSNANAAKAPFYLSQRPGGAVAVEFTDVQGHTHNLETGGDVVSQGDWYHLAGVSDGSTLRLYLNGSETASQDLTASGSADTRLSNGLGTGVTSGTDWTAGTWTVSRGMYDGNHVDRFLGAIDDVAISDAALEPADFVVPVPETVNTGAALTVDTDNPTHQIDPKVYGQFLEHIYHSANGGLWGDLVWNRSFELNSMGGGNWSIDGDEVVQSTLATDAHIEFGDPTWTDYEVTLEARKESGAEGFMVLFRVEDSNNFYWLNLGGWGNTQHAIEKEVNGGRNTIGSQVPGSVSSGQWYTIRIRCEGSRFRCWLDDDQVLDVTNNFNPHASGGIGLGTWATQARYRNIRVTSLDGSTELFSGLPTLLPADFSADFWDTFGDGQISVSGDALNNDNSVRIVGDGSATGVEQDDYMFTEQKYSGSLWVKGSAPDGISVELRDGSTVLGEAAVGAPTGEWAEYPFEITPTAATDDGTLRLGLQGAGTVMIDQVSLMGQDSIDTGGYRPDLLKAVEDLRPPIIRWPGGCFASLYLWKDGIGPQETRRIYSAYMWEDQDINSYGTDEFIRMCEKMGTEPLLVVNTGVLDSACGAPAQFKLDSDDDYLPYALEWMEYCNGDVTTTWGAVRAANGHPEPYNVTYWEIDNETWAAGSDAYIEAVRAFAPAMRAKAAELGVPITLLACGGNRLDMSWNRDIIDTCATLIDYISIHNYEDPGNFDSGVDAYEDLLIALGNYIATSANPNMKIYNSEWNAQSTDWRTGLYAGGLLNAYERQGAVFKIGGPALFLRHTSADAWDNAFINFDHTGWFPAPNYVVMKLWYDHYAPNFLALQGGQDGCNIVATRGADGRLVFLKAVNPTNELKDLTVELTGSFAPTSASMRRVAPGSLNARNTLAQPNAVRPESAEVTLDGRTVRFALPAYSAGVVTLESSETTATRWTGYR
jgi:alpha-N-arabinofuranosidase